MKDLKQVVFPFDSRGKLSLDPMSRLTGMDRSIVQTFRAGRPELYFITVLLQLNRNNDENAEY
ncbi:MAG: hypothetical protein HEP71_22420 [Roseivirga sp.]|nr:hypothetical protein [Roseivirga sp.]